MSDKQPDPWLEYRHALDGYERSIRNLQYPDPFAVPEGEDNLRQLFWLPENAVRIDDVNSLLDIKPPHGYELIKSAPAPIPGFPSFPKRPVTDQSSQLGTPTAPNQPISFWRKLFFVPPKTTAPPACSSRELLTSRQKEELLSRADSLQSEAEALRLKFQAEANKWPALHEACAANNEESIKILMSISHLLHWLPKPLRLSFDVSLDLGARIALCTVEIPDFGSLQIMKQRKTSRQTTWNPVSSTEKRRASETVLYTLCIRAACLIAYSDEGNWFDTIAINARQNWNDRATGQPRTGVIASLQATSEELLSLRLDQVDPKACFRHLKGISTPSVEDIAPVRPIFVLNTHDNRIVEGRDITQGLDEDANLAAMPWDDFEHLVRQLYEWEFGGGGAEVRVTRSSRDRGVDAIVFDPDPLRGGKFVIQAKRYTRPVDVAAVRDLYGTLLNEGANRGILVTTSSYGPDAYAFARDKPISLVDGAHLIAMLRKHGRSYKIDLAEARRLSASTGDNL